MLAICYYKYFVNFFVPKYLHLQMDSNWIVLTSRAPRHLLAPRKSRGIAIPAIFALAIGAAGVAAFAAPASATAYVNERLIASDTHTRESAVAWGNPEVGGAYTYTHAASFSANGRAGVVLPPRAGSSVTANLGSVSAEDTNATTSITFPKIPSSGYVYAGVQVRAKGSSYYQSQLRLGANGTVTLALLRVNGSTASQTVLRPDVVVARGLVAGEKLWVDAQVTGRSPVAFSARAWVAGSTRPSWQSTASDSTPYRIATAGSVGLWTYISTAGQPQPVAYDDLTAYALRQVQTLSPGTSLTPNPTSTPTPTPSSPTTPTPSPTSPADPSPATSRVPTPDPETSAAGARGPVGAAAIGTTSYPVPVGAIFVAANGSASGTGSQDSPLAGIQAAIDKASNKGTVVVRAGTYRGSLSIPRGKDVTIQSAPREAVWIDGSRALSQWSAGGAAWSTPWNIAFDSSPTYTRGAPDGSADGWAFVNPAHPLAAHPDQVWVDGGALAQVGSRAAVTAGTFFVDAAREQLVLGSDPRGHDVRASDTAKALTVLGDNSVIRGIGIRRFAPSVPDIAAVTVYASGVELENLSVTDNATTGLSVDAADISLKNITVARNGMLGAHANYADRLSVSGMLSTDNNTEHFNRAPVAGGLKITRSRDVSVVKSAFLRNDGNGLWFDESVYNGTVVGNDILSNSGNALVIELSSLFTVANNIVGDNGLVGVLIGDSNRVQIWNNTVTGNNRNINIVQGDRRASNLSDAGHDPRQTLPDPTVTWVLGQVTVKNNILANSTGNCILCVEDYSHQQSAEHMDIVTNGNVYQRTVASQPSWAIVWSRGAGNPAVYTSIASWTASTGQDRQSLVLDGRAALTALRAPLAPVTDAVSTVAQPLPSNIAGLVGRAFGTQALGAWPGY